MSWFGQSRSPGGSLIVKHENAQATALDVDALLPRFTEEREPVYERIFGKAICVSHEVLPLVPHVDVYTFARKQGERIVYSLVTGGMSDLPMTLPPFASGEIRRAELVFYCSDPKDEYIDTLRWLAHFPHTYKTCVGYGHTIPNGNPPAPFWGSEALDTILLMQTIVARDQKLPEELKIEDDPVHFLWVVPLTTAECNLKLQKGFSAILGLFGQHHHPHVFDPARKSYV